jgi:hypothetical protein
VNTTYSLVVDTTNSLNIWTAGGYSVIFGDYALSDADVFVSITRNGYLRDGTTLRFNGTNYTGSRTLTGTVSDYTTNISSFPLVLGTWVEGVYYLRGYIRSYLIFGGTDTSNIEKAEGYLAHRYDKTSLLPVGHPYKTSAPTI